MPTANAQLPIHSHTPTHPPAPRIPPAALIATSHGIGSHRIALVACSHELTGALAAWQPRHLISTSTSQVAGGVGRGLACQTRRPEWRARTRVKPRNDVADLSNFRLVHVHCAFVWPTN
jgi:hypothetical protein